MLRIAHLLEAQLRAAMEQALPATAQPLDPQLAPASKPEFGDFQANGALPLAKPWASRRARSPRRLWRSSGRIRPSASSA